MARRCQSANAWILQGRFANRPCILLDADRIWFIISVFRRIGLSLTRFVSIATILKRGLVQSRVSNTDIQNLETQDGMGIKPGKLIQNWFQ